MKDSFTGQSRGFGFVTFDDPASLLRALKQDHIIDGKMVIAFSLYIKILQIFILQRLF